MKRALILAFVGLILNNCFSQNVNSKYFIGGSVSYTHDNLTNNRLLSNYFPYDKNNSDVFEFFGEFGINLNSKSALGFDLGYILNRSEYETTGSGTQGNDYFKSSASGFVFNPKYRITKGISERIDFFTDLKLQIQYLSLKNIVTQSDPITYQTELLSMNGGELKYGVSIVPGLIFNLSNKIGIKINYELIDILHSTITKSRDSDIDFKTINAWDYGLNMKLTDLRLGIIIKI